MDLTIDVRSLKKALALPKSNGKKPATDWNNPLRLVALGKTGLSLQATSDATGLVNVQVDADVTEQGTAVIGLYTFDKLLTGKGTIRLHTETVPTDDPAQATDHLVLVNGATTTLPTLSGEVFDHKWPSFARGAHFNLDLAALAEVLAAASNDENRAILTGVLFNGAAGEMVATDSYRLHIVKGGEVPANDRKLLIPGNVLRQVLKAGHPATVAYTEGNVPEKLQISAGPNTWFCHAIEGEFPNYASLVPDPKSYPNRLIVPRDELVSAIAALPVSTKDRSYVRINAEGTDITLTYKRDDTVSTMPVRNGRWTGSEPLEIGFTPYYLSDLVAVSRETDCVLAVLDHLKPIVTSESHPDGTVSTRLLMPVRLT